MVSAFAMQCSRNYLFAVVGVEFRISVKSQISGEHFGVAHLEIQSFSLQTRIS